MKAFLWLLLLVPGIFPAQTTDKFFDLADDFFGTYTINGLVKYAEIEQNPKLLKDLLNEVKKAKVSPQDEAEFKAFWINAYNIAVIREIINHYPVASPLEIPGFFDKKVHSLGQQSLTLDEIEKNLLLGKFPEEERFHFVLVCAAKGCPPLLNKSYRPDILENQLQQQTSRVLNDPEFVRLRDDKVLFSEIMKWYREDFLQNSASLIDYTNQYRKEKIPADPEIGFYEYDWNLNGVE